MTEPLQVGQFAIVDHEPVDRGPSAGIFHGKGPTDDRAELYIIAEGTTPGGDGFAGHVISAAGRAWNTLDISLTGALRRLYGDVDANVRDWNRKSLTEHRVALGVSAFGRRGQQAVIAQAGPGAVFHFHRGSVQAYFAEEDYARPLSGEGGVEPQLTRIEFDPGDRLLLLTSPALRELDTELISGILTLDGEKVLAELYHRLQHLRNLSVLLIQKPGLPEEESDDESSDEDDAGFIIGGDSTEPVTPAPEAAVSEEEAPEPEPATPTPVAAPQEDGSFQPTLFFDDRDQSNVIAARRRLIDVTARARQAAQESAAIVPQRPIAIAEMPQPLRRAAGDNTLANLAAERRARAAMGGSLSAIVMPRPTWQTNGGPALADIAIHDLPETPRRPRRNSFTRSLVRDDAAAPPEPIIEDAPRCDDVAEDLRARAAASANNHVSETIAVESVTTLSTGGVLVRPRGNMGGRWKANSSLSRRRTVVAGQQAPTWLVITIGLGILLALVGVITVPRMLSRSGEERYAALIDEAQHRVATANANPDAAARRADLTQAQALLLEARELANGRTESEQLLTEVGAALGAMDAVRTPASVEIVASLEQFGDKPVAAARLAVASWQAFVLDNASAQVIGISLETGERHVLFAEDREAGRGQPVAIALTESDVPGEEQLLIADSNRTLWAINSAGVIYQLEFGAPKNLGVTDMAIYGRDLFVLDAAASTIYQFAPTEGGFGQAPVPYLETPDLAAARRMLVDHEIVTADADGTIHRFVGQLALALSEAGIDKRLVEARQPNRFGDGTQVAIVDAPENRIVVFRADGAFDHQYRHELFGAITALTMRDGVGYVFAGGKLERVHFGE